MAKVLSVDLVRATTEQSFEIRIADSTAPQLSRTRVDAVLTSPPYCTRIDYTAKGAAVLVVQDSFYKDIHNDLPLYVTEIAERRRLVLKRRADFEVRRSMSGINPKTRTYRKSSAAVESVLCFEKA